MAIFLGLAALVPLENFRHSPSAAGRDLRLFGFNLVLKELLRPARRIFVFLLAAWFLRGFGESVRPFAWVLELPFAVQVLCCLVIDDFYYYGVHRWWHSSRWLWPIHEVHHLPTEITVFNSVRVHFLEAFFLWPLSVLLLLMGFSESVLATYVFLSIVGSTWNHSNVRVGPTWPEKVFVTPRYHRWHHANGGQAKNLGALFTFWDRIFGTYHSAGAGVPQGYTIERDDREQRLAGFLHPFREWRAMIFPKR